VLGCRWGEQAGGQPPGCGVASSARTLPARVVARTEPSSAAIVVVPIPVPSAATRIRRAARRDQLERHPCIRADPSPVLLIRLGLLCRGTAVAPDSTVFVTPRPPRPPERSLQDGAPVSTVPRTRPILPRPVGGDCAAA
jgi:hypothetical protein